MLKLMGKKIFTTLLSIFLFIKANVICTLFLEKECRVSNGSVMQFFVLPDFLLAVKAATLIFISGCGSAISSAKEGNSGFIYNLVKS